jgi:dipeptidyl aminopeptidase/acylaminoacyl peptidase
MTRRLFLVLLVALSLSFAQAPAQQKKLISVDDLYRFDGPRDLALSPDGKAAVFVRQWIDPATKLERNSLWRIEGSKEKTAALETGEPDARAPVYSPDGKWLAFLSTRARPDGWKQTPGVPPESDPAVDIWLMPAAGGPAIPLAGPEKAHGRVFHDGFYGRLAFSPDSSRLAFIADDGADPRTTAEKTNGVHVAREDQGEGYTGYGAAQLWIAYLDAPVGPFAATRIVRLTGVNAELGLWYGDPQWRPDGKSIAVHGNWTEDRESVRYSINKNYDIWLIDAETGGGRRLTTGPGPDVSPRFSPDGKRLAYLSVPRKGSHRDAFNLAVIDLTSPDSPPRLLIEQHTNQETKRPVPIFPLPSECWDGNNRFYLTCESGVHTVPVWLDVGGPSPGRKLEARLSRRAELTPAGNAFLKGAALAEAKAITWKSSDGQEIEGVVTTPPAEANGKPPYKLVVYPHGGPHSRSTLGFDFTVQLFAANGYAVFQPNFRGSSGYGQKFIDADRGDFGGGDMRDILTGIDKLIADGIADKNRLFVYGISYGGYMTTWLVGQTDRFKAAVAQNAVTDLTMMWSLSDIPSWTEWEFGGKPWEVPDKMRQHSPLTYVEKVTTPTLILHAAADRRCPLPMGKAYYTALKARNVPTGLVVYPDEGHGIRQPKHREDVYRRVLEWFARYEKP